MSKIHIFTGESRMAEELYDYIVVQNFEIGRIRTIILPFNVGNSITPPSNDKFTVFILFVGIIFKREANWLHKLYNATYC